MAPPMHHQQQKRWPMPRPEGGLRWGSWCSRGPSMPRAASSLVGGCAAWLARVAVGCSRWPSMPRAASLLVCSHATRLVVVQLGKCLCSLVVMLLDWQQQMVQHTMNMRWGASLK
eukprot:1136789-Pelagomonas_calceolata.AAC.12